MNYPLISEYIEAIKAAEDNFDQLKHLRPVLDENGEPVMSSGNFAVVFQMEDEETGKLHAVKCFLKEQEGRAEAYRQIAEELEYVSSTFLTPIKYLDKELFVDSANSEDSEFPVLLMDWVEGETLDKYIQKHVNRYLRAECLDEVSESEEKAIELLVNSYELENIAYQFSCLAIWLLQQPFAHGDLKPDNIIVKEDGTLVLVDYDGMYVPAMKGQKARELGSPDFRHPLRNEDDFDEHIDDFPLSSILLSLLAIANEPFLWEKYGGDGRLLLSERDYRNIAESKVLDALRPLMADKNLTTFLSLFYLCSVQKSLFKESYQLFCLPEPEKPYFMVKDEDLSTEVTEDDLANAWTDEYGAKYSKDKNRLLSVPTELKDYVVRSGTKLICDKAFSIYDIDNNGFLYSCGYNTNLVSVTLPNGIKRIGDSAFYNCENLLDIKIPNSVVEIGNDAFANCKRIQSITMSDNLIVIGERAFSYCEALNQISLPNSIKTIGYAAFYGCNSLRQINIPNSITKIEDEVFAFCPIKRISIPNFVIEIGSRAFWGSGISRIDIPQSVTEIGEGAFFYSRLETINLSNSINEIKKETFCGCELSKVIIPNTISKIDSDAFAECLSLIHISLPNTIKELGSCAFQYCDSLVEIDIPNSVSRIESGTFEGCTSLKRVHIPESVTFIGARAFKGCCSLESIILPQSISVVENDIFMDCDALNEIIIPFGSRVRFVHLLSDYRDTLIEQDRGWRVKDKRPFSLDEITAVARAEVVSSQYGNSVCFFMNSGGQTYIPLLGTSSLTVGDSVDLKTAKLVTLCREGEDDIYRVEA